MDSPIEYPSLKIPGKGTYILKFGMGAVFTLENDLGMDIAQVGAKLQECFPERADDGTVTRPGKVNLAFLFKIVSACIWDQIQLEPRTIADCFNPADLPLIATTVLQAFAKAPWLSATSGTATTPAEVAGPLPN